MHTKQGGDKSGICTGAKGLNQSKNKDHVQHDTAAACLFCISGSNGSAILSSDQKQYWINCCCLSDDRGHAPVLFLRNVRERRQATGKGPDEYLPTESTAAGNQDLSDKEHV